MSYEDTEKRIAFIIEHQVSLVRVVSWIDGYSKKPHQENKKLTVCFTDYEKK